MLRREFRSSVVVHSASACEVSPNSRQRKYNPRVLFSALNTSLQSRVVKKIFLYLILYAFYFENIKHIVQQARTHTHTHTDIFVALPPFSSNKSPPLDTYSLTTKKGSSKDMTLMDGHAIEKSLKICGMKTPPQTAAVAAATNTVCCAALICSYVFLLPIACLQPIN